MPENVGHREYDSESPADGSDSPNGGKRSLPVGAPGGLLVAGQVT